jgi:hypothetical protein
MPDFTITIIYNLFKKNAKLEWFALENSNVKFNYIFTTFVKSKLHFCDLMKYSYKIAKYSLKQASSKLT